MVVADMKALQPGSVRINQAEFLAALINCETFTDQCSRKYTLLQLDNTVALQWVRMARCPIHPLDRCAQAVHLHMLRHSMKVEAKWMASDDNFLVDWCSRVRLPSTMQSRAMAEFRLTKVTPRWAEVLKYL